MPPDHPVSTAEQVADLIEAVAAANELLAAEANRFTASRRSVSHATVARVASLAEELGCGAQARAELGGLDVDLLLAGTSVWLAPPRAGPRAGVAAGPGPMGQRRVSA